MKKSNADKKYGRTLGVNEIREALGIAGRRFDAEEVLRRGRVESAASQKDLKRQKKREEIDRKRRMRGR